ncbi:MAG: aldehyde ferredoxin oxidoreductase C-terminal domain-containing protein [Dehalococcoidia bacterium]|nr:aldehyde ferredoxin oxidoreductase C-terminal domain-containing protein [Dehalococcoidia bacterium]
MGVCQFSNALPADLARFVSHRFGVEWRDTHVLAMARRAIEAEREFNRRAGLDPSHDRLPRWLREEPLETPDGPMVFDIPDELLDRVWSEG